MNNYINPAADYGKRLNIVVLTINGEQLLPLRVCWYLCTSVFLAWMHICTLYDDFIFVLKRQYGLRYVIYIANVL